MKSSINLQQCILTYIKSNAFVLTSLTKKEYILGSTSDISFLKISLIKSRGGWKFVDLKIEDICEELSSYLMKSSHEEKMITFIIPY